MQERRKSPTSSPGQATALAVRLLTGPIYRVVRFIHRATLVGAENLPEEGPYLLVGNHPPCFATSEFFSFGALWAERFGNTKPIAAYTHVIAHRIWPLPWLFAQVGAIPSTYEAAFATIEAGVPIVMFPGGDHEALKPFWQRGVDFHGREGFLKIARRYDIPIIPMATSGQSAPVLLRSRAFAPLFVWPRFFGIKRWGITVQGAAVATGLLGFLPAPLPIRAFAAWAYLSSPLQLLSWVPTKVKIRIGRPMPASSTTSEVEVAIEALLRE